MQLGTVNSYIAIGSTPQTFFVKLSGRGAHLTVELFDLPCEKLKVGERTTQKAIGKVPLRSYELVPITANATMNVRGNVSHHKVLVSVVFPTGVMPQLDVVSAIPDTAKMDLVWRRVASIAKTYKWAEQGGAGQKFNSRIFSGPIQHWPNSFYAYDDGNNSNTFVRYIAKQLGWALPADLASTGNEQPVDPTSQEQFKEFLSTIPTAPTIDHPIQF